jgi:putative copper export protein
MSTIVIIHICAVAFWFGVVGAETVIEKSRSENKEHGFSVARNHFYIDIFLEIPAALTVMVTGVILLSESNLSSPMFLVKVIAGMFAVGINLFCLVPVFRRKKAADSKDLDAVKVNSSMIDKISVCGIPAGVIALAIGILGNFS